MAQPPDGLQVHAVVDGVFEVLPDPTAVVDASGTIVAVNRAWRMFALDNGGSVEATGVGVSYLAVCDASAAGGCTGAMVAAAGLRAVLAGRTVESDHEYPCPSPTVGRWFVSRIVPVGRGGGAVVAHLNITRRRASELELEYRATRDPLTGLANRLLFTDRLNDALRVRPEWAQAGEVGVLAVDLDRFKGINDTFGHDAGDEVLLGAAHAIRTAVRPGDTVARLAGDEFVVCASRIDAHALSELSRSVHDALDRPHRIHGRRLRISGRVGCHLAQPGESAAEVLRIADRQVHLAKHRSTSASAGVVR